MGTEGGQGKEVRKSQTELRMKGQSEVEGSERAAMRGEEGRSFKGWRRSENKRIVNIKFHCVQVSKSERWMLTGQMIFQCYYYQGE